MFGSLELIVVCAFLSLSHTHTHLHTTHLCAVPQFNQAGHQDVGCGNGLLREVVQGRKGQPTAAAHAQSVEGQQVPAESNTDGVETGRTHSHELGLLCEGLLVHHGAGCCEGEPPSRQRNSAKCMVYGTFCMLYILAHTHTHHRRR